MSTAKGRRISLCSVPECTKQVQSRKLCRAHGGGIPCRSSNCNKLARSRGFCVAHGGGRRCSSINCTKLAQYKGLCLTHGGGRRCRIPNCHKFAQIRGCCTSHSKLLELGLSRVSWPRADTSPEEFQAYQPSIRSGDSTSHSSLVECGNDSYTHTNRSQDVISSIMDRTTIPPDSGSEASRQEIPAARATAVISPLVLYRPLCRRLYCQPRHIQDHGVTESACKQFV